MVAEIIKVTMRYLAKFRLNLKTLTYSSMERKPSLSWSACSNAEELNFHDGEEEELPIISSWLIGCSG